MQMNILIVSRVNIGFFLLSSIIFTFAMLYPYYLLFLIFLSLYDVRAHTLYIFIYLCIYIYIFYFRFGINHLDFHLRKLVERGLGSVLIFGVPHASSSKVIYIYIYIYIYCVYIK